MAKAKMDQEKIDRMSRALDRQLKGIVTNAKIAEDATYGENYQEILAWLKNVQSCLDEANQIACDLRDEK
jgi:hypothetical protein